MAKSTAKARRESAAVIDELSRIGVIAQLTDASVITATSLDLGPIFKGRDFSSLETFEIYESLGRFFGRVHRSARWWMADWLNYGEGTFGDRFEQAVEATGLEPEYLRNIMWVGSNVFPSVRLDGVAFALHQVVAPLTPDEQRRWLARATAEEPHWTVKKLREAIAAEKNGGVIPAEQRERVNSAKLIEAARLVAARSQKRGAVYEVESEAFAQLLAALGDE